MPLAVPLGRVLYSRDRENAVDVLGYNTLLNSLKTKSS
jgi:hypothetical protein